MWDDAVRFGCGLSKLCSRSCVTAGRGAPYYVPVVPRPTYSAFVQAGWAPTPGAASERQRLPTTTRPRAVMVPRKPHCELSWSPWHGCCADSIASDSMCEIDQIDQTLPACCTDSSFCNQVLLPALSSLNQVESAFSFAHDG